MSAPKSVKGQRRAVRRQMRDEGYRFDAMMSHNQRRAWADGMQVVAPVASRRTRKRQAERIRAYLNRVLKGQGKPQ